MIFFLLIWSLCSLGFLGLACAMSKHQKQIFNTTLSEQKTRLATIAGWFILIITLVICIRSGNLSNMISYWIGVLTFAALFIGICLSYFERKIKMIGLILGVLSFICLILYS